MAPNWSTLQLTEFFAVLSGADDEDEVLRLAVERAVEILEAEVGAVVVDGEVRADWGLGADPVGRELLRTVGPASSLRLPGLDVLHTFAAHPGRGTPDFLVVGRLDLPLEGEERQLLQAMAQLMGLVLGNVRALAAERALREDKEREAAERLGLLEELRARQRQLERLLAIQQAISARRPLPEVLDEVTGGAADLLEGAPVALVVAEQRPATRLDVASRSGALGTGTGTGPDAGAVLDAAGRAIRSGTQVVVTPPGGPVLLAAPVSIGPEVGGGLVAVLDGPVGDDRLARHLHLLATFAQQASLALTDARTVEAVAQAKHDLVTGLPSRALFLDRLGAVLARGGRDQVLFIDLDRFKAVNDSLGHRAGDELLAAVAGRIVACLRAGDVAARIGGDEFAVLLPGADPAVGVAVAERVIEALCRPFRIHAHDVVIGASVGVAERGSRAESADDLLSNADVAMYRAKKTGAGQVLVFRPQMLAETVARMDLLGDLQRALRERELRLHYQPLVELRTGRAVGAEGLLRWTDARRGPVPPGELIPLAEESNLIMEIGRWALEEGAGQLAQWRPRNPALGLSLNISPRQLLDRDFVPHVAEVLGARGLPPGALTLELTETALMTDPDGAVGQLHRLKELGVRLAVDDFGTGYSSLSYLRRFPVDQLKIDRSFIARVHEDPEDLAVARTVIQLGRALRLQTVAEGIETAEQAAVLGQLGCDLGQGYHLARPLPPEAVWPHLSGGVGPAVPTPRGQPV